VIEALLKAKPERSDRATAKIALVDHKTVAAKREKLEAGGEIPHVETRTDTKGRQQPAAKTKPPQKPADPEPPEPQRPAVDGPSESEEVDKTSVCEVIDLGQRQVDKKIMAWVATFDSWSEDHQEIGLNLVAPAEITLRSLVELKELLNVELKKDIARLEQENQSLREQLALRTAA
jgi:hypothetical protein